MTDYSNMSNFEINKAVGSIVGYATGIEPCFGVVVRNANGAEFNPCNNPADAWPIIVSSGIGFYRIDDANDGTKDMIGEWHATGPVDWAYGERDSNFEARSKNPLRAAMIVFLMTKESKQC